MKRELVNSNAGVLSQSELAIKATRNQAVISSLMAELGYNDAALAKGEALCEVAKAALDANKKEADESSIAYASYAELKSKVDKDYRLMRKKAKVAFRKKPLVLAQLALEGEMPRAFVGWQGGIRTFCITAINDEGILNELAVLKTTKEDLETTLSDLDELQNRRSTYLIEKGESQQATQVKDEAFRALDDWMRDFYAVAKIAMEDQPQLLESIGIVVKS